MPTRNPVLLAHNALNNAFGSVYHRAWCGVLARTYGTKEMSIEAAESMGRAACAWCHRLAPTRIACPWCDQRGREVALSLTEDGQGLTILQCSECKRRVRQLYKPDKPHA